MYGTTNELPTTEGCKLNPMSPYALQKLIGDAIMVSRIAKNRSNNE